MKGVLVLWLSGIMAHAMLTMSSCRSGRGAQWESYDMFVLDSALQEGSADADISKRPLDAWTKRLFMFFFQTVKEAWYWLRCPSADADMSRRGSTTTSRSNPNGIVQLDAFRGLSGPRRQPIVTIVQRLLRACRNNRRCTLDMCSATVRRCMQDDQTARNLGK